MKIGLSIKIDVTKIDKSRLFKGEKGTYLDLSTFVDLDSKDQYENNGFISQSTSKDERESGVQTPILGNVRVFFNDSGAKSSPSQASQNMQTPAQSNDNYEDDIPF